MTEWRMFRDNDGDTWYEIEEGLFVWGFNRADALERSRRYDKRGMRLHSLTEVQRLHGPITELTD